MKLSLSLLGSFVLIAHVASLAIETQGNEDTPAEKKAVTAVILEDVYSSEDEALVAPTIAKEVTREPRQTEVESLLQVSSRRMDNGEDDLAAAFLAGPAQSGPKVETASVEDSFLTVVLDAPTTEMTKARAAIQARRKTMRDRMHKRKVTTRQRSRKSGRKGGRKVKRRRNGSGRKNVVLDLESADSSLSQFGNAFAAQNAFLAQNAVNDVRAVTTFRPNFRRVPASRAQPQPSIRVQSLGTPRPVFIQPQALPQPTFRGSDVNNFVLEEPIYELLPEDEEILLSEVPFPAYEDVDSVPSDCVTCNEIEVTAPEDEYDYVFELEHVEPPPTPEIFLELPPEPVFDFAPLPPQPTFVAVTPTPIRPVTQFVTPPPVVVTPAPTRPPPSYHPLPAYGEQPADDLPSYDGPAQPAYKATPVEDSYHGLNSDHSYSDDKGYDFSYNVIDPAEGLDFGQQEVRDEAGRTFGEYHVALPDGRLQTVTYSVQDKSGFIADVKYEGEAKYPEDLYGYNGYQDFAASSTAYASPKKAAKKPAKKPSKNYGSPQKSYQAPKISHSGYAAPKKTYGSPKAEAPRQTYQSYATKAPKKAQHSYKAPNSYSSASHHSYKGYEAPEKSHGRYEAPNEAASATYGAPAESHSQYSAPTTYNTPKPASSPTGYAAPTQSYHSSKKPQVGYQFPKEAYQGYVAPAKKEQPRAKYGAPKKEEEEKKESKPATGYGAPTQATYSGDHHYSTGRYHAPTSTSPTGYSAPTFQETYQPAVWADEIYDYNSV